jgi:nucleoside-diphosphate-sugar epimerase
MKKVLVLGGTQFFGKKAVKKLLDNDHQVTIATRGNTPHPFGDKVNHIILDARDGNHNGWKEVIAQNWDAVFSNVCYTKEDAQLLIDKFRHLTDHVYFTSSMSVYMGAKDGYTEADFDPTTYQIDPEIEVDYGEGKRQAEAILFNEAPFQVTAFRFPIVLDLDDHTKRLHFYVEKALNHQTIYFQNEAHKVNYVKGTQAAGAIVWAIENEKSGIYNVSAKDAVPTKTLMAWIEEVVGHSLTVEYTEEKVTDSPFSVGHHQYLISDKIEKEGFDLLQLEEWMKPLIKDIHDEMKK